MKAKQSSLEDSLINVISSPTPTPGRALRNLVGRCLVALYTRGETRTLFDTMQAFLKIVSDLKAVDKEINKMYAFVVLVCELFSLDIVPPFLALVILWQFSGLRCIFQLYFTVQSSCEQFMSFMAEIYTITLKTVKTSGVSWRESDYIVVVDLAA